MAENKDQQPHLGNQSEGMTGNDGSKGNLNRDYKLNNELGSLEEGQQRDSSTQGHQKGRAGQGALETNTGAGGAGDDGEAEKE